MKTEEMLDIVNGIEFHKKAVLFHTQVLSTLEETLNKRFKNPKVVFHDHEEEEEEIAETPKRKKRGVAKLYKQKGKRVKCVVCSRGFIQALSAIKRGSKPICSSKCSGKRMGLIKAGRWDKEAEKEIHQVEMQ